MSVCKDCLAEWVANGTPPTGRAARARPAPHPGPRCATHHRARKAQIRTTTHARRLAAVYHIDPEFYAAILAEQGGACAICQRATGKTKRLAVDHDHSCCDGPVSCGQCVRGLLCGTCNKILGHFRDDPKAALRMAAYLTRWPAKVARQRLASLSTSSPAPIAWATGGTA